MGDRSGFITVSCANHHEKLIGALWNFFLTNRFVDFDIRMGGGQSIRAHRLLLELFLRPEKLGSTDHLPLSAHCSPVDHQNSILALVEFLYKGHVTVGIGQLDDLMQVAKESDFQMLVNAIESVAGPLIKMEEEPYDLTKYDRSCRSAGETSYSLQDDESQSRTSSNTDRNIDDSIAEDRETDVEGGTSTGGTSEPVTIKADVGLVTSQVAPVQSTPVTTSVELESRLRCVSKQTTFACDLCGRFFSSSSSLISHRLRHVTETRHKCPLCSKKYMEASSLDSHIRSCHPKVEKTEPGPGGGLPISRTDAAVHHQKTASYECRTCRMTFAQYHSLANHMLVHEQPMVQPRSSSETGRTDKKSFECSLCGRRFTQKICLVNHAVTHTGAKPFRCECGAAYSHYSTLYRHRLKLGHGGRKNFRFKCHLCGAWYARRDHLDAHVRKCMP